jgi:hypothetical protein
MFFPCVIVMLLVQHRFLYNSKYNRDEVQLWQMASSLNMAWPDDLEITVRPDRTGSLRSYVNRSCVIEAATDSFPEPGKDVHTYLVAVASTFKDETDALHNITAPLLILGPQQYHYLNMIPTLHGVYTSKPYTDEALNGPLLQILCQSWRSMAWLPPVPGELAASTWLCNRSTVRSGTARVLGSPVNTATLLGSRLVSQMLFMSFFQGSFRTPRFFILLLLLGLVLPFVLVYDVKQWWLDPRTVRCNLAVA